MESGLEKQINEFLEKFSNRSVEDDFMYNTGLIRARSNNMDDYDALEMTGIFNLCEHSMTNDSHRSLREIFFFVSLK